MPLCIEAPVLRAAYANVGQICSAVAEECVRRNVSVPAACRKGMKDLPVKFLNTQSYPLCDKNGQLTKHGHSMWLLFLNKLGFKGESKLSDVAKHIVDNIRLNY